LNDERANDDDALEARLRIWALPVALVLARSLVSFGAGRFVTRLFIAMWVHESGHAIAAWLCGYLAFPGPWLTPMSLERSPLFALLLSFLICWLGFRAWKQEQLGQAAIYITILCIHLYCWLALSPDAAKALVTFSGDGGCLVLGTLLMCAVYSPEGSVLHNGWLRWGCLAIGAGAFMDTFEQWWAARTDVDRIPFGMNEGVGLSDPSVLSDVHGWSAALIVHRYVLLGCSCLAFLGAVYLWGLLSGRSEKKK
jgi:hypothetical protein